VEQHLLFRGESQLTSVGALEVGARPAGAHQSVARMAAADPVRKQQMSELVRDCRRQHRRDRHIVSFRLQRHGSIEHIRDAGAARRAYRGAHHRVRALPQFARFVRQHDDAHERRIVSGRGSIRRPVQIDADAVKKARGLRLRTCQGRRRNASDIRHVQHDRDRDGVNHAIDCAQPRRRWRLRQT
jgi:hypothetical protein